MTYRLFVTRADNITFGDDTDNPLASFVGGLRQVEDFLVGEIIKGVHYGASHSSATLTDTFESPSTYRMMVRLSFM